MSQEIIVYKGGTLDLLDQGTPPNPPAGYARMWYNGTADTFNVVDSSGKPLLSSGGGGTTTNSLTMNNSGSGSASGATFNGSAAVTLSYNTLGAAPTASPTFTGTPTAPTNSTATDASTQIATDAFVQNAITAYSGALQFATVTLTPTQIKNLDNTVGNSVQLLPSPGVGKAIMLWTIQTNLQFATTPYATSTGNLIASYDVSGSLTLLNTFFVSAYIKGSSSQVEGGGSLANNLTGAVSTQANGSIVATISSATKYTAGDSPILINMWYTIVPAS